MFLDIISSMYPQVLGKVLLALILGGNYTRFFVRKIGYINFVPKSVRRPSVRLSVCPSVTFLVIVSSPKPLDVAT